MGKKILSVSLNPAIDQIIYCKDLRLNSKNMVIRSHRYLGGKGRNVAITLRHLAQEVSLLELLGEKNFDEFRKESQYYEINPISILINGNTRTNIKIIDGKMGKDTELNERGIFVTKSDSNKILNFFHNHAGDYDFICLSGSLPIGIDDNFYKLLISLARESGAECALDTSGFPLKKGIAAIPTILHLNNDELNELLGDTFSTLEEIYLAAQRILDQGIKLIIVSMGGRGSLINNGTNAWYARPPKVKIKNTIGAGDVMLASCIRDYLFSAELETILSNATALATLSTTYMNLKDIDMANLIHISRRIELSCIR